MDYHNVLLIDDDDDDREIFKMAIDQLEKVNCVYLDSAVEALELLIVGKLKTDVIFLDLNMPIMTGLQFLDKIKQIDFLKSIPIIIFSTSSNQNNIREAKELGAQNYIVKPYTYNELLHILRSVL